jgi:hypothetical protein
MFTNFNSINFGFHKYIFSISVVCNSLLLYNSFWEKAQVFGCVSKE